MSVKRLLPLLVLLCATPVWAQSTTPVLVQSVPQETRASVTCPEQRGTGAQTLTISAVGGKFFYLNFFAVEAFAQAGAAANLSTPASITTTNIAGSPTFGAFAMQAQAAGAKVDSYQFPFSGNGLKAAAAGTAVTFVAPSVTNVGWHLVVCGYYADAP